MSQPTTQQATKNMRIISVATIRFSVAKGTIEESKRNFLRHRKLDRDRVDRLKEENVCRHRENYIVT